MKVWVVVLATWFWLNITFGSARVSPLLANDDHHNFTLDADTIISFTTQGATNSSYSTFLQSIRDAVKSGNSNGIPVLSATVAEAKQYLVVKLSNQAKDVTIGLNVINLYVVAYQVGDNSYFFSDAPAKATTYLFKGTKQTMLKFSGSYDDLKKKGADRLQTQLGVLALSDGIYTLNKSTKPEEIASPLLVIIQMVAEATRFTYIERKVITNFGQRFKPLPDVTSRENNWGKLSSGIQTADANGKFKNAVQLQYSNGTLYNISTVSQIKPDMGILLYVKK
uniref:rRNA N-glycosylase n=1 Tax=Vernicia fordii TaxID=73154 RepID=A0A2U8UBC2_VERFO|nr:fordin [Vernicia fordii]AXH38101.1 fordin [Vernicia fordii]